MEIIYNMGSENKTKRRQNERCKGEEHCVVHKPQASLLSSPFPCYCLTSILSTGLYHVDYVIPQERLKNTLLRILPCAKNSSILVVRSNDPMQFVPATTLQDSLADQPLG